MPLGGSRYDFTRPTVEWNPYKGIIKWYVLLSQYHCISRELISIYVRNNWIYILYLRAYILLISTHLKYELVKCHAHGRYMLYLTGVNDSGISWGRTAEWNLFANQTQWDLRSTIIVFQLESHAVVFPWKWGICDIILRATCLEYKFLWIMILWQAVVAETNYSGGGTMLWCVWKGLCHFAPSYVITSLW